MFKIIIYKDKITSTSWDDITQSWLETEVLATDSLPQYFHKVVEIKEDVTVEHFMFHLEKYEKDIDYCFAGYMGGFPLKLYIEDMKKEPLRDTDIKEIELFWFGEILNEELNILGAIRGWLNEESAKEKGLNYEVPYGMEFTPLNTWKHCPLLLNENITINDFGDIEAITKNIIFDGFKVWTLHDVISNFLCDLTENGTPEERDALVNQIENKKYNVHEVAQDKEQTEFWLGFLQAELTDSRVLMDKALDEENYEEAARLKSTIEILTKEILELKKEVAIKNNKTKADE